jgi:hypothetical protein
MQARNVLQRSLMITVLAGLALALSGCGLPRMVESYVSSFIGHDGAVTHVGFQFERLPSQQNGAKQAQVEDMASAALGKVGLHRDAQNPRYSVQLIVQMTPVARNPARQLIHSGYYAGADGLIWEPQPLQTLEQPWYSHSVRILLRDLQSQKVAYESTAVHEGPWPDSANLLPIMLDAALRGYPNPPSGVRRVVTELPPLTPLQPATSQP